MMTYLYLAALLLMLAGSVSMLVRGSVVTVVSLLLSFHSSALKLPRCSEQTNRNLNRQCLIMHFVIICCFSDKHDEEQFVITGKLRNQPFAMFFTYSMPYKRLSAVGLVLHKKYNRHCGRPWCQFSWLPQCKIVLIPIESYMLLVPRYKNCILS